MATFERLKSIVMKQLGVKDEEVVPRATVDYLKGLGVDDQAL
ncbi:unnamed protein product [marine sediment metagenome]|uniref:Uncharacterized protein n=1 Tax=marine sediment metagenome TaxID=412755 RepID=X1FML7_9ZZZZ